jgi:hypothetical protein
MRLLKKILKIVFYLVLIIFTLLLILPYVLDKSKCLFAETRLLAKLKEANETKNLLLLNDIAFDSRVCGQKEIYNQASKMICADFNYDNFIKELNEANKTKNKRKLKELDLQSHRCIDDINISNQIQDKFELYKLYWREQK